MERDKGLRLHVSLVYGLGPETAGYWGSHIFSGWLTLRMPYRAISSSRLTRGFAAATVMEFSERLSG